MTTNHNDIQSSQISLHEEAAHRDAREKETSAFIKAEQDYVAKILAVIRGVFSTLSNIADIMNRYASITSTLAHLINILSLLPVMVVGPIGSMIYLLTMLTNDNTHIATKIVNLFTITGSFSTSIISMLLQSIAMPLIIVGAALGIVRDGWSLGELFYKKFYLQDKSVTMKQFAEAGLNLVFSVLSLVGAALLLSPFTMPFGYALLLGVAAAKLIDSAGFNPLRKLSFFQDEVVTMSETTESKTLSSTATVTVSSCIAGEPSSRAAFARDNTRTNKWTTSSRFHKVGFYKESVREKEKTIRQEAHQPVASLDYSMSPSHRNGR